VRRRLVVLLALAACAGFAPSEAAAGTECDGLIVCIPVQGPWVQVVGGGVPTYYQLSCPGRGQVIGGLDADRAGPLELTFLGSLGGPISPGITTSRRAVFVARTTTGLASFRPLLGCIPASGGGGGRSRTVYEPRPKPTRSLAAAAPGPPALVDATIRRVRGFRVAYRQRQRVAHGCLEGERLLAYSHAVAFRSRRRLALSALGSVRATSRAQGDRIVVNLRSGDARPQGLRVDVQVHAICARGPS
jgi:hypothetical protein